MILYFSATGNCRFVAEQIAEQTGNQAISMQDIPKEITLTDDENLGIVVPTYYWGLPSIVDEILSSISIYGAEDSYIYTISTYGTTPGQTAKFLSDRLKEKGLQVNAVYSIKMPDTWTPTFNLSDKEKVAKLNREELPQMKQIISWINQKQVGDFVNSKVPMPLVKVWKPLYESARKTSHLKVESNCVGCGLCAKNCPVQAIEMRDGRPVWVKKQCTMCLQCLHKCPKFAIQYGNSTKNHGQYVHPKTVRE